MDDDSKLKSALDGLSGLKLSELPSFRRMRDEDEAMRQVIREFPIPSISLFERELPATLAVESPQPRPNPPLVKPNPIGREATNRSGSDRYSTAELRAVSIDEYVRAWGLTRQVAAKNCGVSYSDLNTWKLHRNSNFSKNGISVKTVRIESELAKLPKIVYVQP